MSTLLKPIPVRTELLQRQLRIFTPNEFMRIFGSSPLATKYFLETQVNQGFLSRLKQGVYALKTDPPTEPEVANKLYRPSYISFTYALAYHHITPEMTYYITSATTKPTRLFTTTNISFAYYTLKPAAYTGYYLHQKDHTRFLIAEPEKALVDYLYFYSLGKTTFPALDRLNLSQVNQAKTIEYAQLFNKPKLIQLVKKAYAQ